MTREQRRELLERFERATELPLLLLAVAMVPLTVVPLVTDLQPTADSAVDLVDWIIWAAFGAELVIGTYLDDRRPNFLLRHWYDVLIVGISFPAAFSYLRTLRVLRLLRLLRTVPLVARILIGVHSVLRRRGLQYVILVGAAAIFGSAGCVYFAERGNGGTIDDYGTALWWAMTTVTTVGYGDTVPTSPVGRGTAVLLMVVGISFFSWVTANIAAFLVEFGNEGRSVTMVDLMEKLEALERELQGVRESRA